MNMYCTVYKTVHAYSTHNPVYFCLIVRAIIAIVVRAIVVSQIDPETRFKGIPNGHEDHFMTSFDHG